MTFATYRKLTGRPVPRRIMEGSFTICIILLLSFMLYVSYRDVLRVGLDAGFIEDKPNGTPPEVTQPEKPETAETSQIEDLTAGDAENAETNNE